jgi:LmbE family N-acetylglucosaminyl deacetylase
MNVLAIGSHPDDIEIGCFGTLAKHHVDGDLIFGVIVTKGENGGNAEIRMKEAHEAAKIIDMKLIFGEFPDGDVRENAKLITFLDNIVKENKIDVIYTHSLNDRHQDHRSVSRASLSVSRNVQEVYCYEAVSLISAFTPQVFVDVTETFGYKISALRKYESQVERTFVEGLEGIARYRAAQTRLPGRLCEAFEAYKILRNENSPKVLELSDLRNQVEMFKKILANMENDQNNNSLINHFKVNLNEDLRSLSSPNSFFEKNDKVKSPLPRQNIFKNDIKTKKEIDINDINQMKDEIIQYKEEMEKLKKEIKGYREGLLLKREIELYKVALEKATSQQWAI